MGREPNDRRQCSPARVAVATVEELTAPGQVRARAECVRALAAAVRGGPGTLEPGDDLESDLKRLTSRGGIGLWTAAYISMRTWRRADASLIWMDLGVAQGPEDRLARRDPGRGRALAPLPRLRRGASLATPHAVLIDRGRFR